MTKADPEFFYLCIYHWSGERGQNLLDKATISSDDRKKWEILLGKWYCKPRGRKIVAATLYKVLTQGDMELPEYIETSGKSLTHVDGQKTQRKWLSATLFFSV